MDSPKKSSAPVSIWWFAFGYFAAYAPYAALTKAVTKGALPGQTRIVDGYEILPLSVVCSLVGMLIFITRKGWWRYAGRGKLFGLDLPMPNRWTGFSGVCTAIVIITTTLAYTFKGVSIVFVMLLMRGGVLVIAPINDRLAKRPVKWYSWVGLALSLVALVVADRSGDYTITTVCAIDVIAYLFGYFVRLRFMSKLAKSDDPNANLRYFVEEQMVGTPFLLLSLLTVALVAPLTHGGGFGDFATSVRHGFGSFFSREAVVVGVVAFIGVLSQGTGIFGGLILLDKRENSYCVPVNRASSILAGLVASVGLYLFLKQPPPSKGELAGAALIVAAISMLSVPPLLEKRRAAKAAA